MQNHPHLHNPPRLLIVSIAILGLLGSTMLLSCNRDKSPPRPKGEYLQSRVDLVIQSNVSGAEILVDGQQKAFTSDTKFQARLFKLPRKTYQITLKKEGYAERTEAVAITGKALTQTVRIDMEPVK
jgi:uncharacterized membrane protein